MRRHGWPRARRRCPLFDAFAAAGETSRLPMSPATRPVRCATSWRWRIAPINTSMRRSPGFWPKTRECRGRAGGLHSRSESVPGPDDLSAARAAADGGKGSGLLWRAGVGMDARGDAAARGDHQSLRAAGDASRSKDGPAPHRPHYRGACSRRRAALHPDRLRRMRRPWPRPRRSRATASRSTSFCAWICASPKS
jgi:hypothetical protein